MIIETFSGTDVSRYRAIRSLPNFKKIIKIISFQGKLTANNDVQSALSFDTFNISFPILSAKILIILIVYQTILGHIEPIIFFSIFKKKSIYLSFVNQSFHALNSSKMTFKERYASMQNSGGNHLAQTTDGILKEGQKSFLKTMHNSLGTNKPPDPFTKEVRHIPPPPQKSVTPKRLNMASWEQEVLLKFSQDPRNFWSVDDAREGTSIIGGTGSGKTSGSGKKNCIEVLRARLGRVSSLC